jgi:superfamily II DNA or RNA helicase
MKLYPPQQRLVDQTVDGIRQHNAFANTSSTGTGKTIQAVEAARALGLAPLVIAPLATIPSWTKVFEEQGVTHADILGWERVRGGRTPHGSWSGKVFIWAKSVKMVVADEAHRACNYKTRSAAMLTAAKRQGIPLLMLSATLAEDPTELGAIGFALGLHKGHDFIPWALKHECSFDLWRNLTFTKCESLAREKLKEIHDSIYKTGKGGRLTRKDLAAFFQNSEVIDSPLALDPKIAELYDDMGDELGVVDGAMVIDLKKAKEAARRRGENPADAEPNSLTKLLRLRQRTELLKLPTLLEFLADYRREGFSVAIFVNFSATIEALRERISEPCSVVQGGQNPAERNAAVERFQLNQVRVIILNTAAGGTGINLHDLHGVPRASLVSPSFDAKIHHQVIGRIDRAGSKSPSIQRVLVAAGTVEERVQEAINTKLANLAHLHENENHTYNPLTDDQLDLIAPPHPMPDTQPDTEVVYNASEEQTFDAEGGVVIAIPEEAITVKKTRKPRTQKATIAQESKAITSHLNENGVLVEEDQGHGICEKCFHAFIRLEPGGKAVCGGGHLKDEPLPKTASETPAEKPPAHAEFGPSSLKMFEVAPMYRSRHGTNEAAEMGTRIHKALETDTLDTLVDEERVIADKIVEGEIQVATHFGFFAEGIQVADHKEIRMTIKWDGPLHCEERIDPKTGAKSFISYPNETFGTMDRLLVAGDTAIAIDYKTGRGAIDDPEVNCQAQAYAAGVFQMFPDIQTIHFAFIVPVRDEILVATYTRDQLPDFLLRISTIILRARTATTCNPQPGICDFCANQASCQQLADKALLIAKRYQFDGFPVPEVVHGSKVEDPEDMAVLLKLGRLMEDWGKAVKSRANYFAFEQDNEIPGFTKMSVKGKSTVLSTRGAAAALAPLGLTSEDILDCSELKVTKVEELVSERAPRGKKGDAAQSVRDTLLDSGLLSQGEASNQLRVTRK